jgi:hypothetical protein
MEDDTKKTIIEVAAVLGLGLALGKLTGVKEIPVVAGVGYLLAQGTKRVPLLNNNTMVTRTALYTLGYYLATRRPAGGYKMLEDSRP